MSWYRRYRQPGGTFFFTVVTNERRRILTQPDARSILRHAISRTRTQRPFECLAMVLLDDHLHCLWRLPPNDDDFPTRWRLIKARFTRAWLASRAKAPIRSKSRTQRGEQAVWQRRYWEHLIRDETDLKRHIDYIHFNPVKHGYVARAADWPHSTFGRFVGMGEYQSDWGQAEPDTLHGWRGPGE